MSESMQITPSSNVGAAKPKQSLLESSANSASTEDPAGFTAVFASYVELEPEVTEQQIDENLTELLSELLPQTMLEDGNSLPEGNVVAMWQSLMMLPPTEKAITNLPPNQSQNMGLLDGQRKPALNLSMNNPSMNNPSMLNQDYFNFLALQNKEPGTGIPANLALNNMNTQFAAAQFIPDSNNSILFNVTEQLIPVQGTNSSLSQGLAAVGFGTATQAATTQTHMAPLNLGQNAWETNLSSRLQMMVGQNVQTAEIRLDPPELGALDIKIKISNDVATINISSPHSHVRDALETAVPRLREMFQESGLSLGDVNVRQESFAQQQNSSDEQKLAFHPLDDSSDGENIAELTRKIVSNNMLDTYA